MSNLQIITVKKSEIAKSGEYNLSGDRYRVGVDYSNVNWPMVELGDVCEILDKLRRPVTKSDREAGEYPYYGATGILDYVKDYIFDEKLVLIGEDGAKWGIGDKTAFIAKGKYWVNNHAHVLRPNREKILDELLVELINNMDLMPYITGVTVPKLNQEKLRSIKIPLPPLEVQEQIVAELDGYQRIIDGAKQIVESWKPQFEIDPEWEKVELGEIGKVSMCKRIFKNQTMNKGDVPFYKIGTFGKNPDAFIKQELFDEYKSKFSYPKKGDILISTSGTIGKTVVFDGRPAYFQDSNIVWIDNNEKKVLNEYLNIVYQNITWLPAKGVTIARLYNKIIEETGIPLPPLETQKQIVEKIEAERELVDGAKKLIEIYEDKMRGAIGKVWGGKKVL